MDRDTDLFVQAFWVKCRDVVRPELDRVIDELKGAGHDANVSTQEYSPVADQLPDIGPVLTLTVHPNGASEGRPRTCSGDMYETVPRIAPGVVSRALAGSSSCRDASPKSRSVTPPARVR